MSEGQISDGKPVLQCGVGARLALLYIYRNSKSTSLALEAALSLQVIWSFGVALPRQEKRNPAKMETTGQ